MPKPEPAPHGARATGAPGAVPAPGAGGAGGASGGPIAPVDGKVGRSFLALASGDALARVIAFAAGVYVGRTLSPAEFGIVTLSTGLLLYFSNVVECGIDLVGVREVARDEAGMRRLAPALIGARLALALLLSLAIAAFARFCLPEPEATVFSVYGVGLLAVALSTRWIHLGLQRPRIVAVARTVGELLYLCGVLLLVRRPHDIVLVPVAQIAGDALAAVILWIALRRLAWRPAPRFDFEGARPVLARSWPLVGNVLLGLTIYNSDLVFLYAFQGRTAVGFYSAAYQLISFLINMAAAYSLSLLPALTRAAAEPGGRERLYKSAFAQSFAVALPIAVGGALVAPQIIRTVFGAQYEPSIEALAFLVCTIPFTMSKEVDLIALVVAGREATVLRMTALAVAVNLTLNVILIPRYGILGAAWSTLATEAARAVFARICARGAGYPAPALAPLVRPLCAGGAMAAVLCALPPQPLPLALALGAGVYAAALAACGGIVLRRGGWPALRG